MNDFENNNELNKHPESEPENSNENNQQEPFEPVESNDNDHQDSVEQQFNEAAEKDNFDDDSSNSETVNAEFVESQQQYTQNYDTRSFNASDYRVNLDNQYHTKQKDNKKGLKVFSILLVCVFLLSLGVGVGYLAGYSFDDLKNNNSSNDLRLKDEVKIIQGTVPERDGIKADENGRYNAEQVARIGSESVVRITIYNESNKNSSGLASGVILDENGYVISNDHIYSGIPNAKFVVTLHDGRSFEAVYIAGDSRSDLCVLKMQNAKDLTPAVFGDSSKVASGDDVIAIGSPYGLSGTVTKGIISAPSRRISFGSKDTTGATINYSMRVIQTDVALNYGNSGGALINMYGQVVGINSSKIVSEGYEGLCFAIPANDVIRFAKSLIENRKVVGRAKLGITYLEISSALSVVEKVPFGLQIQEISLESDLYKSGLVAGDIITQIDSKEITSADIALDVIDSKESGDTIKLKVYIASTGKHKNVSVKLLEDISVSSYSTAEQPESTTGNHPFW